ncbi:Uncharacterized secreted protein [Saitozyma sp. JCM 24511]|nr:Uncharacterized secreted protein [Saitozyma sp. JCM 24511]
MLPTFILSTLALASSALAATTCNGHSELCNRSYGNVTFVGTHDSYAVGSSIADNQDQSVTQQLNDGVRMLQVQAHNTSSGIHLCHSSCSLLDGGSLTDYLTTVASWVKSNPNDVISILIVNSDNLPPTAYTSSFDSAGLTNYTYSPSSSSTTLSAWPTLGTLIDAGTRVVVFMDYDASFSSVPWIIDEFSNMWEDAYDVTSQTFGCAVNRTSGTAGSQLMLINHFLDTSYSLGGTQFWVPDKTKINATNSASGYGSIGFHVGNCQSIWGRNPNHILLDFYDSNGNAPFDLAATLNSVSAPTNTVSAGSIATATTTGSTGTAQVSASKLSGAVVTGRLDLGLVLGMVLGVVGVMVGAGRVL